MELNKVIKLLNDLPQDAGLDYEENWDDSIRVQNWRKEVIEALKFAVKVLESGDVIGTLHINGEEYKVTK